MKRAAPASIFLSAIIVVVVLISVGYLFVVDPERQTVSSLDGRVTVSGLTRESQSFSIDASEALGGTLIGPVYEIQPADAILEEPVTVTFDISDRERASELVVYRYDNDLMMWVQAEAVIVHSADLLSVEADRLGDFSLGLPLEITSPMFLSVYDELLDMAPEGAVGYEVGVAVGSGQEPRIQIPGSVQTGGCDGLLTQGNREETSIQERDLHVLLSDIDTLTRFTFVARWFVSDLGGCPEGVDLESFEIM